MQVPFPAVTMPTCVRRKLSCEPKETWWGPGIISSSLWSPLNRPMSSRSHKRRCSGKHTGSELTSKESAHFLYHIIQRREREGKKILLSIDTNKPHNPHFMPVCVCVWVGGCVDECAREDLYVTPIWVFFSPPEALVAPQMHETQPVRPHTHTHTDVHTTHNTILKLKLSESTGTQCECQRSPVKLSVYHPQSCSQISLCLSSTQRKALVTQAKPCIPLCQVTHSAVWLRSTVHEIHFVCAYVLLCLQHIVVVTGI